MMPQTGRYAIRAMVMLARQPQGAAFTAKALAELTGVPGDYLSKILRRMVIAGLLNSRRGRGGGFSLARRPDEIRFIDVLTAVGVMLDDSGCAYGWGVCGTEHPCPIHNTWAELKTSMLEWAARHTLQDGMADLMLDD